MFPINLKAFAKKRAFPAWSCQSTPSVMEFNPIWATVNIWYIAPSHQFLKSVLSFFRFWYIRKCYCFFKRVLSISKMSRILLSINLNFGCSSYVKRPQPKGHLITRGASQAAALVTSATTHWVRSKARFRSASVRAGDETLLPNCPKCVCNQHCQTLTAKPSHVCSSCSSIDSVEIYG